MTAATATSTKHIMVAPASEHLVTPRSASHAQRCAPGLTSLLRKRLLMLLHEVFRPGWFLTLTPSSL